MTIAKIAGAILLPCWLLMPLYSVGQETTSAIERQAAAFLQSHYSERFPAAQVRINISQLPAQFKQHHCPKALKFKPPRSFNRKPLIRVSCDIPGGWSLYLRADASVLQNALVLKAPIRKGQRIDPSMVEAQLVDALRYKQSIHSIQQLNDVIARRSVPAGRVLSRRDLTMAPAISEGDAIMIQATRGGLSIRTAGYALESGHIGEQIRATNNRSGKEVRGIIRNRGLIEVP